MNELAKAAETNGVNAKVKISTGESIEITVEEFARLKDIETRFEILKREMLKASYCPIHHQIILGIENEYAQQHKEIEVPSFMQENKQ